MGRTLIYRTNTPVFSVNSTTISASDTPSSVVVSSIPDNIALIEIPIAFSSGAATVTDSNGNLYLGTTTYGTSGIFTRTVYCENPIVTPSMTFNINASNYSAVVMIVVGSTSGALDAINGNTSTGSSSISSGSITPSMNGELIIAAAATGTGSSGTPPAIAGFTLVNVPFFSGNYQGLVLYYQIQSSATTISVTFAGTSINYFSSTIVAFHN